MKTLFELCVRKTRLRAAIATITHVFKVVPSSPICQGYLEQDTTPLKVDRRDIRGGCLFFFFLIMFPTMKRISYKSEVIANDFAAVFSGKMTVAYFLIVRARQPYYVQYSLFM